MVRDYTKYNVEGLGENLSKRQLVFNTINSWARKNKCVVKFINILIFSITILEPTYSQVNLTVSDYSFEKFEEYGLDFEPVKQKYLKTNIESCQLNEEDKLRFNEKISSTISLWNSVNVLKHLKASKVVYGIDQERLLTEEEIVSLENFNELLGKRRQHTLMSLVVTEEKDTLLLFFISRSLMCKNVKEINYLYKQLTIANDSKNFILKDTTLFKTEIQIPLLVLPLSTFNHNYEKRKVHIEALNSAFASTLDEQTEKYTYYIKQEIPDNYQADIIYGLKQSISKEVIAIDSNNIILSVQKKSNQAGSEFYPIYNTKDDSFLGLLFYSVQDDRLQFLDAVTSKQSRTQAIKLKEDVLTLKKHISILKENKLELTESERKQFNKNIQNRIINSLNSKLPKFYLTIVNRVEPNSYTKTQRTYSYCYIVEKYASNHFFGLGQKHDTFPIMDVKMVDDPNLKNVYLLDTIAIDLYNLEDLKQKIKSTDYLALFSEREKTLSEKREYYSMSGQTLEENPIVVVNTLEPFLTVTDTLYSTKDFGKSDNGINFYLASKPSYEEFLKNHIKIPSENEFPFLNITSIVNMHIFSVTGIYNKSKIYFDVVRSTARSGLNVYDVSKRDYLLYDLDILIGTNRKEMYNYTSQFLEYNVEFDKKVQAVKKKRNIAAEEEEKKARQELHSKYGKKYVDAMYELKIIVGMPEDLVNVIVNKLYTVGTTSSSNNGNYYRLDPRYGTGWVSVWIKNKKVTSVTYH